MRIITGCLQPTPKECLRVLAGIPPPNLGRVELTSKFVNKVVASEHHPLHSRIHSTPGNFYPDNASSPDKLSPVMQRYYMVYHSSTSWNLG